MHDPCGDFNRRVGRVLAVGWAWIWFAAAVLIYWLLM
jgi:hypothetical protein